MPQFHPQVPPAFLAEPNRDAERRIWTVLQQLDPSWHVFYSARENSRRGFDREIDFVLIWYNRVFYLEVKGGLVIVDQRAGAGVTWAHYKRSGELAEKRVDPKQLWMAKAALGKTVREITGKSPKRVGFLEHDFHVFPHTPRSSAPEQDLERANVHYAFAEDVDRLPQRLVQIVRSEKGVFIEPKWIDSTIQSFDAMVIRGGDTLSQRTRAEMQRLTVVHRHRSESNFAPPKRERRQKSAFRWTRRRIVLALYAVASLVVLAQLLWDGGAKRLPGIAFEPAELESVAAVARPASPIPVSKPIPVRNESALPQFIPGSAVAEVEQTIALAQQQTIALNQDEAVPLLWQSGIQHGFVTLLADEGNGCRRYRVSRNDQQPARHGLIRRCS